jgi:hypothetical protein
MSAVVTPAKAFDDRGKHTGPGPWLTLIHECNRITEGTMFGEPKFIRSPNRYIEVYPTAEVIMRLDAGGEAVMVTVRGTTTLGSQVIREAAGNLGMAVS